MATEVVFFIIADGGGFREAAPGLRGCTLFSLPGCARKPGQPQAQQVAQGGLLGQRLLVHEVVKLATEAEAGQKFGADGLGICVQDSELQVEVFHHLAREDDQVAAVQFAICPGKTEDKQKLVRMSHLGLPNVYLHYDL